jgi:hypothetical protein
MKIWGVAYEFDEHGNVLGQYVEESDDEQDARDWAQASGDPDAKVVYTEVADVPRTGWTVA